MKTAAIYLAAGTSRRMGTDKRSLFLNGVSLGSMALKHALLSELDHIFVITGKGDSLHWLSDVFFLSPMSNNWSQAECEQAGNSQGHSIQCGVKKRQRTRLTPLSFSLQISRLSPQISSIR